MALNSEQIGRLLKKIQQTQEEEMTCPECLDELDRYAQRMLDDAPIDGVLDDVRAHLEACPCCTNQYELILETIKTLEES